MRGDLIGGVKRAWGLRPKTSRQRKPSCVRKPHVITYRATLDVPCELVRFVSRLLAAERHRRGTRRGTRALTCWFQAVLVLRWFRERASVAALGRDLKVSQATAYRYLDEAVGVLADIAPDLREALEYAHRVGLSHVVLDGMVIATDRVRAKTTSVKGQEIDVWYSGKHHHHGANIQFLTAPDGYPLWVSEVRPGSVHDLNAARELALPALYHAATRGLPTLADKGYEGAGIGIHTPTREPSSGHGLATGNRAHNMLLIRLRCLGERAAALLTQRWRTLQHITVSPNKIGDITKAALALTHFEYHRPC